GVEAKRGPPRPRPGPGRYRSRPGRLWTLALLADRGVHAGNGRVGGEGLRHDLGRAGPEELVGRRPGPVDLRLLLTRGAAGEGQGLGRETAGFGHRRGAARLCPAPRRGVGTGPSPLG